MADRNRVLEGADAGLRIGEALALRSRDVDLLASPPRINVTRSGTDEP
jgi:integrase